MHVAHCLNPRPFPHATPSQPYWPSPYSTSIAPQPRYYCSLPFQGVSTCPNAPGDNGSLFFTNGPHDFEWTNLHTHGLKVGTLRDGQQARTRAARGLARLHD